MKSKFVFVLASAIFFIPGAIFAYGIILDPQSPIQGEPLMISVEATSTAVSILFDGKSLGIFNHRGRQTAFYGIDLTKKAGMYPIVANLRDGTRLETIVEISARKKIEAPLGIPLKLGGNTQESAANLVSTLAAENAGLLKLRTGSHAFWRESFQYPVDDPVVTDEFGYQRKTLSYSIAHRGTDFRAQEGTKVRSMNRGVVRVAREGRNYGKTIVVDHGLGLQTFYMHLSKINVNVGELVLPGQVIGLSGQTGYAGSPHLHLTVRINDVSVDPIRFLKYFQQ